MNAADQRRLSPFLAAACVAAAAVLAVLALGAGRGVHWQAAGPPARLPAAASAKAATAPPLSQFADVWRHPLFTADRQPAPEEGGGAADVRLGDLELTGIILTPDLRMALLHGPPDHDVEVREGDNVGDSGWTLTKLYPRSAVFERAGQRTELKLKVAKGSGGGPGAAASGGKPALVPVMHPRRVLPGGKAKPTGRAGNGRIQALRQRIESRRRVKPAPTQQEH